VRSRRVSETPQFRLARPDDAEAVARLHADSWRRHYRGAYSDAFLDGDVLADRLAVWTARLREPDPRQRTVVAEQGSLLGFAHTVLDDDPMWGALLDNMHVAAGHKRRGIGARLLRLSAEAAAQRPGGGGLYLWVLEQNVDAQAFYEAHGGEYVERSQVAAPGGIAGRLTGSPAKLRYAWPEAGALLRRQ
jgi:ribosomal protein S18 acetylase RimI-like enzyme